MSRHIPYPTPAKRHYAFAPIGNVRSLITLDTFSSAPGHMPLMAFEGWRIALNRAPADLPLEISGSSGIVLSINLKFAEAVVMKPRTTSSWRWTGFAECHVIEFPSTYIADLSENAFCSKSMPGGSIFHLTASRALEAVNLLGQTLDRAKSGSARIASGFADVVATRLLRSMHDSVIRSWDFSPCNSEARENADASFEGMVEYLHRYPGHKIDIEHMSELSGLSRATLNRAFKKSFGETPMAFLRRLRAERANELLQSNELTLSQIAIECGFYDQAHMSKILKANGSRY